MVFGKAPEKNNKLGDYLFTNNTHIDEVVLNGCKCVLESWEP